jgi:hypothetical protein
MRQWLKGLSKPFAKRQRACPVGSDSMKNFVAVGYPKVGNTWLRITLGRYLYVRYQLPEMPLMDPAEFPILSKAGCHAIGDFTHHPLEWTKQTADDLTLDSVVRHFQDDRVLLLVRNPLDTLVSFYMQERYRNAQDPFTGSLVEFIEHPVLGLEKLLKFYQVWQEGAEKVAGFSFWRYEDARLDPAGCFGRFLEFLGEEVDPSALDDAVEFASFENLKALETSGQKDIVYKSSGLYVFGSTSNDNPNALHVRKGKIAGYRDELPPALVAELEQRVKAEMPALFGYS